MAAGDYRLRIWSVTGFPMDHMVVEYEYGTEDGMGNTTVIRRDNMLVTWDEFVALTTTEERTAMASINVKLTDEIKVRVPLLEDALAL